MRIALVSYEYAGVSRSGGIGTYIRNTAKMLSDRGHNVEVFTTGQRTESSQRADRVLVHTILASREEFSERIVPIFARRFNDVGFDVVEGPEYNADSSGVAAAFPGLALVVKLHGPSFAIFESNASYVSRIAKLRFFLGGLVRGRIAKSPWKYDVFSDSERVHAVGADEIVANSDATAERTAQAWQLQRARISTVPCVFEPSPDLLQIEASTRTRNIMFLGRLEVRKGVIDLAYAIPLVLKAEPEFRFTIVGRSLPHPQDRVPLVEHMKRIIGKSASNVEFIDGVPYEQVPRLMRNCDICVFPSHWEASGYVCMEAMAAARGVIGSSSGGMAELIDHGRTGLLVPPMDPKSIAGAILSLIRDTERRIAMGNAARERVLKAFSPAVIAPLQEASYERAMQNAEARSAGPNRYIR